jgi:hypothetical protein
MTNFSKIPQNKIKKNHSAVLELLQAERWKDGQTDRQGKANRHIFAIFGTNALKNNKGRTGNRRT